ncbi:signal peptidase I [Natronoglomus mannanivorans]|uniref:Signal peptidase I n=1 Tax=Natronoglomus mannanivorans TaxID=2979990 RepID=A0AAP2Z2X4_9EURY|nr:signal peptidase I [Halobacteria archaeon AArc-xg1-1]
MTARAILERTFTVVVAIVVIALVLGQLLGQPILLGYVTTGSMEPTIDAGDGFVAIPSAVAGSPEPGDVVVFEATELHDGGLTTHRIVDVTADGYVTAGDANPFTDQDGGEPPVSDGQIVATALQVNGHVVTIPHLGTAVMGIHGVVGGVFDAVTGPLGGSEPTDGTDAGAILVAMGVALLGLGVLFDRTGVEQRQATRSTSRENVLAIWAAIAVVLFVLVSLATVAMVLPSGVAAYELVSTDDPTDDPQVLAPGETGELTRTVDNAGYLPTVVVFEASSTGIATDPEWLTVGSRDTAETTVSLTAPDSSGEYTRHVGEHRYIMVLPPTLLVWLHGLHPLIAIAAVNGVVVGVVVAILLGLYGTGDLRIRRIGGHVAPSTRLRRKLQKWR